ncbi:TolC family protein [Fulvivirga sediminis]|uniref:TolC family protein n=1 Tax=Fulvivirga sediminis TaxID=2803949 RepID=A0A937F4S9_9BACT|nr:TolC family protein [Fulvivirga sediminis]MBL3655760.1 TolC family protein [Fulvivirga sediminis]
MRATGLLILLVLISVGTYAQDTLKVNRWTLQECIDHAMDHNLNIRRSLLDLQSQEVEMSQSKWARYPDLNGNASYGYSWGRSIDPTTNLFVENQRIASGNAGLSSSILLFNGFRLQNTVKQNQYSLDAAEETFQTTKNDVVLGLSSYYINVLFTRELLENARKQLNSTNQQVERTEKQVEVGALPKSNLLDLMAQKATNELNVVNAENNYTSAKIQLKQLLQLPPEEQIDIVVPEIDTASIEPVMDASPIQIYEAALNGWPSVRSAELNVKSSEYAVKASRGYLYPSLTLTGGLTTRYSDVSDQPRFVPDGGDPIVLDPNPVIGYVQGTNTPVISEQPRTQTSGTYYDGYPFGDQIDDNLSKYVNLSLNIPIFNGFSARASIQRAEINRSRAEINSKDAKYQLWQNIEQAYIDVVAAAKSYKVSQVQVEARTESFRVLKQRYDNGAANFTDYKVGENDLFQAKSDLLRAKYDYVFKLKVLDFYQGKKIEF